jgi:protein-disulfide isomerase
VSVAALDQTEVLARSVVTPEEAKAFYTANKARFGTTSELVAVQQIQAGLGQQREAQRRAAFARELHDKYDVKVLLEPYRVPVAVGDAPVRGNPEAPVTIVEFSDFQCPYCGRARPTVARIREVYGPNVRWVFRHFPLGFHTSAPKAGEAAVCAGDQGHFWEMHDHLFADQSKLGVADLKAAARAIGLDAAAFDQCLDSGRHADLVESDTEAGSRYGVSATPAFFINGRPVIGAQPFEAFARVIDEELDRLGLPAVAEAQGAPGGR